MEKIEKSKAETLVNEIENILSEIENEDETVDNLYNAMEYFCSTWDKCEGFKEAIRITLQDQWDNHSSDLTVEELETLKKKLTETL